MTDAYPIMAIPLLWLAAYTDLTRRIIRNWISVTLLLLFVLYVSFSAVPINVVDHIAWAGAQFAILLIGFIFAKIGGGDVKLATVVMLWAGPEMGPLFLFATALSGGLLALGIILPPLRIIREWALAPLSKYMPSLEAAAAQSVPYGAAIAVGGTMALYGRYIGGA